MSCVSGYALRLQCQLDKRIKFNGIARRSEPCQSIMSVVGGGVRPNQRTPGSAPVRGLKSQTSTSNKFATCTIP